MHIKRFSYRHIGHLTGWLNIRSLDPKKVERLPLVGYIVFDESMAVAVGFLRRVEGDKFAIISDVVSNPHATVRVVDTALALIYHALTIAASHANISNIAIMADTESAKILARRLGFVEDPSEIFVKKIQRD